MDKKIMIISRALSHGGAERVATNLATYLSNYYEVLLVVLDGSRNTYGSTVETIDLGLPRGRKGLRINWYKKLIQEVFRLKKERGITHTISFLSEPDLANVITKTDSKAIISIRNKQSALVKGNVKKIRDKMLFSHADSIVALSEMVKYDLVKNYGVNKDKVHVIYNPCDKERVEGKLIEDVFTDKEKEIFLSSDNIVVTAGRLSTQKSQWHLIRCFSKVVKEIPNAKLLVLGEGDKEEYLKKLIEDLELRDNIFLLGYKSNPYPYLKKANLFAFSSLFEGLGNILLEAMACETPIVSTDCDSGPRELLAPETNIEETGKADKVIYGEYGVLTPVFDGVEYDAKHPLTKEELMYAEVLINLLNDRELLERYKEKSTMRGTHFSTDEIVNQWIDVIKD